MLEALVVSQTLLWILIVVLSVTCIALARQVGALYERIAPAGALAFNQRLSGGDVAPALTLESLDGRTVQIGRQPGQPASPRSQLLFFLSPSCPVCKNLLSVLHSIRRREHTWIDIILASDGDDDGTHRAFVKKEKLEDYPYVVSELLGRSYGVSRLPYAVLVDENGAISALGLVNSRDHLESLFEAKRLGNATIQEFLQKHSEAGRAPASELHG